MKKSDNCIAGTNRPGIERRRSPVARIYPTDGRNTRRWGVSMTIAAIILGLYLIFLFYESVIHQASLIGNQPQQNMARQR